MAKPHVFDETLVRDISEAVYRKRLDQDCHGNVKGMLAKDNDGGKKLRVRAGCYDTLSRTYLSALKDRGIEL
jgi:hypothetical protein